MTAGADFLLCVLALFFPWVAVGIKQGWCNETFWVNFLLTLLFHLPGVIHAWVVILRHDDHNRNIHDDRPLQYQRNDIESGPRAPPAGPPPNRAELPTLPPGDEPPPYEGNAVRKDNKVQRV